MTRATTVDWQGRPLSWEDSFFGADAHDTSRISIRALDTNSNINTMHAVQATINGQTGYLVKPPRSDVKLAPVVQCGTDIFQATLFTNKSDAENALDELTHGTAKLCKIVEMSVEPNFTEEEKEEDLKRQQDLLVSYRNVRVMLEVMVDTLVNSPITRTTAERARQVLRENPAQ